MSLINKTAVRELIMARMKILRPSLVGKLDRISAETFDHLEGQLRTAIDNQLRGLPSSGKTIRFQ
jgi:hypothetical protein